MRSIAVKLTLSFLAIGVLGVALVAGLVNWQTRRQFDALVGEIYQEDLQSLHDRLEDFYEENGSWDGAAAVIYGDAYAPESYEGSAPPASGPGGEPHSRALPVTLLDSDYRVVYGDRGRLPGQILPASTAANGLAIEVEGETVGWLILETFGGWDFEGSPEARFLAGLNRTTLWIALGAAAAALVIGVLLARTISGPIRALQTATEKLKEGQLGAQAPVRSRDEIGQLAVSFNRMSADLAHANELRRQMTADIAHDLRTPLTVIQGYTEALDDGKLKGSSEIFGAMHLQVRHLTRLVEDLRTLSLADAGQLPLYPVEVDPADLLEHSVLVYAPQAERAGVPLRLDLPESLPPARVDPDRMIQVFGNLISNALRHTPEGGLVTVSAAVEGERLALRVRDTGSGIAPEDLPHVFDRFYRGDKTRSNSGESGLGLAIARSIVAAHGGEIEVKSEAGQGAVFTVWLPVI